MKTKDIESGVVYGYRRGKYGSVEPVVFLAKPGPDQLYKRLRRSRDGVPMHAPAHPRIDKPMSGQGFFGDDIGYPVVFASSGPDQDVLAEMTKATLDDFLATTTGHDAERGIRYSVAVFPAHIVGPYDEAVAEEKRRRDAERQRYDEDFARREAAIARAVRLGEALTAHGISSNSHGFPDVNGLVIPLDDVEKLLERLGGAS